ncbi:MAG: hypothetical protein GF317_21935, partial [Candidatus Lokiarchaeota archaeon]|nr:hypothetical protein [Candidatus Lokiarchaeota archaeon]MBD3202120.1 hypothetical protein [Candidatus Lokiarchaeota archaeon]
MFQDSKTTDKEKSVECPFCENSLKKKYSKCYNIYCKGKEFNKDNFVIYRLNYDLGVGKIRSEVNIPASKTLDDKDTFYIKKFKVEFSNNIIKIIHPIDLIHFIFEVNEEVLTTEGKGVINSPKFMIKDGKISYEVILPNGKKTQISELEIFKSYSSPIDEIIHVEEFSSPKTFHLKYLANLYYSYYTSHQIKCITNSRLSLMPHQINVAYRLSQNLSPRMILADEVGLGKTIEAGIYIKEMIARNLADRVLIIVPATLVGQWKFEMENKFNLNFHIYDGKKVKKLNKKGHYAHSETLTNPFYYDNLIICSLQFARNPKYINLLSQISWDVVVFDEAHHLRRYLLNKSTGNYRETLNYVLGRNLSQSTESLLLLTATPLQLHSFELYSLIELVHPELFDNFSDFEHFRKNMPFMNLLISNLNNIGELNTFELKSTIKLLKDLNYVNVHENKKIALMLKNHEKKEEIISRIENDHTLSRILIRNRKKNIFSEDFLNERVVKTIVVKPKEEEMEIYNQIRLYLAKIYNNSLDSKNRNIGLGFVITTLQKLLTSSKYAFLKSLERRLTQIERLKNPLLDLKHFEDEEPEFFESELEEQTIDSDLNGKQLDGQKVKLDTANQEKILKNFYHQLKSIPYDSKSERLLELVDKIYQNNSKEKIIVFTQFVDTLLFLKRTLREQNEYYHIEKFYGGMNKYEKADAVERFRSSDQFSVLLSTDIGGEGRNFQFCRVMINYDLPWNPMKLEQRIGRLDRIGQKSKEIYIYNFFMEGTIETDIIFALNKRIDLFTQSIGNLEPIIGKIEKDFKSLIFIEDKEKQTKLREFHRNVESEIKKAKEMEMQLDDMLIDKKSFQVKNILLPNSCRDIKLGHNELYDFISTFLSLQNPSYGSLKTQKNLKEKSTKDDSGIVE